MSNKDTKYKFKGKVIKCVYNSDNFKVYALDVNANEYPVLKKNKYGNIGINGDMPELTIGVEYNIVATEEVGKYGTSYRVVNIIRDAPITAEDTIAFLGEILTPNQAYTLYENYPDIVERVMNNNLDDIDLSKLHGIGEKTFNNIKKKIIENFKLVDLISEFKGLLSLSMLKRMYDEYSSVDVLKKHLKKEPYTTLTRISGVGFKTADSIISDMQDGEIIDFGFDIKTSFDRCLACILYLLRENEDEGHTKMNLAELRKQCYNLVPACADHFAEAIKDGNIYFNKDDMDIALYKTYFTEKYIADTVVNALKIEDKWGFDVEKYKNIGEFELSDEQMQAVQNVCNYKISILNGPAGSGKSNSTLAIINMLEDNDKTFKLFAPTGKASKVLAEYTKRSASTIHRGLGCNPKNGWFYNKKNKLLTDIMIVDETSMVDVDLFSHLIDAIDFKNTKLLLIGDNAQLPSVSCGNLLHDFMQSEIIPSTTLTKIFRYSDGGLMKVATDTRLCKTYLNSGMKLKATVFGSNKDYTFIDVQQDTTVNVVVSLYKKLLDSGVGVADIQVLTAKNVGDYGTMALNRAIQKIANPNWGSNICMNVGDVTYYKGDIVTQTVNNYNAEIDVDSLSYEEQHMHEYDNNVPTAFVANGENGVIMDIKADCAVIDFDGVLIRYRRENMNMIKHAYAVTVHRSQGSSIKNVILCTPKSHSFMLNSNLLYVGLTRMKDKCYHVGQIQTVNMAVKKKENMTRNTFMKDMLIEIHNETNDNIEERHDV